MKKAFLIIILISHLSCNKESSNDVVLFNPPNWIIGTWDHENPNAALQTYVISENNVIVFDPNNNQTNYSQTIANDPLKTLEERIISNERYNFVILSELPNGDFSEYNVEMTKVSNNEFKLFIIGLSTGHEFFFKR